MQKGTKIVGVMDVIYAFFGWMIEIFFFIPLHKDPSIVFLYIASTVIHFIVLGRGCLLIGGAVTEKSGLVMGGVVLTVVLLIFNVLVSVIAFLQSPLLVGIISLVGIPLNLYYLVVFIGYYLELKSGVRSAPLQAGVVYSVPDYSTMQPPGTQSVGAPGPPWYGRGGNNPPASPQPPPGTQSVGAPGPPWYGRGGNNTPPPRYVPK